MMRAYLLVLPCLAACSGRTAPTDAFGTCATSPVSGAGVLADFCPPAEAHANEIMLSASGEVLAIIGYRFPPVHAGDFALVDGWDISFQHVVTTFDHATLSADPDRTCGDPTVTGAVVAEADGPWAIDLHAGGPLVGKEGPPEQAAPIIALRDQNRHGHDAFDPSVRYAFGFEVVGATSTAQNVNLDGDGLALYQQMIARGCTTLLVGTARWNGGASCTQSAIAGQPPYDFTKLPPVFDFELCLPAPTSYLNAQNPENDPAQPCVAEEHERGVHTVDNQPTIVQATFHIDHVLWESFVHDSPAHFDSFAAKLAGAAASPTPMLHFEDLRHVAFSPFVDALGKQVPWRDCTGASPPPHPTGPMIFDTTPIAVNPGGACSDAGCPAIRDFYDYTLYNHSTFGHLNADGLAYVERHYPSP